MSKTTHAIALATMSVWLLAGCGGQPSDGPAPVEPTHGRVAVAPVRGLIEPAPVHAAAPAASADTETIPLKQQVALLRREVAEIRQRLARTPSAALPAEAPPKPPVDPETRLEAERVEQLRIAATESAFRNEVEDARWSRDSMAFVRAAVADADASLLDQIRSVECRSQSCRVVIAGDPGGLMPFDLTPGHGPPGRDLAQCDGRADRPRRWSIGDCALSVALKASR